MSKRFNKFMSEPKPSELKESIEELNSYRERLINEIEVISKKLRMPTKRIDDSIKNNPEIQRINIIIEKLNSQYQELAK